MIYVRSDLATVPFFQFPNSYVEIVALKVQCIDAIIFSVYLPPNTPAAKWEEAMLSLGMEVDMAQAHGRFPSVMGFMDFNLPEIDWEDSWT